MKKKALLILTPGFAADENDTTCIPFLQQFCLSLQKQRIGYDIVVLTLQYPFETKEYNWHGVRVIAFGGENKRGIPKVFLWIKVLLRFRQLMNQYNPLGVYSIWLTDTALVGKMMANLFHVKHYTWIVGQDARKKNRYVKLIRPDENSLVAFSSFIRQHLHDNFGLQAAHIIPNGINADMFEPLITQNRGISIIGVGSLIPLKRFDLFIDIIEQVSKRYTLDKVIIAGDGPERQNLQNLITDKKLDSIIKLVGSVEHKQVLQLMNNSRTLLHTSEYDSNATVLHEGLYAGCSVVSTCPIDPESAENFFLIQDKDLMIEKIIYLLSKENTYYKRATVNTMDESARRVVELFTN